MCDSIAPVWNRTTWLCASLQTHTSVYTTFVYVIMCTLMRHVFEMAMYMYFKFLFVVINTSLAIYRLGY